MSNGKHETVADIVRGMRRLADEAERGDCYDLRGLGTDSLRAYADRIEAAAKREREAGAEAAQICGEIGEMVGREATCKESVTNCNQLGNAAAKPVAAKPILGCTAATAIETWAKYHGDDKPGFAEFCKAQKPGKASKTYTIGDWADIVNAIEAAQNPAAAQTADNGDVNDPDDLPF